MKIYGHIHSLNTEFLDHKYMNIATGYSTDSSTNSLIPNCHNKDTDSTCYYSHIRSGSSIPNSTNSYVDFAIHIYIVYCDKIDYERSCSFVFVSICNSCQQRPNLFEVSILIDLLCLSLLFGNSHQHSLDYMN